jgi:hypothetical protein
MSTNYSPSIESRARRLASKVDRRELIEYAKNLQKERRAAAVVFYRALQIQRENQALAHSLRLTDVLGDAVYQMRPNGPLPGDGIGAGR